ncbi:MAG: hypothetical protein NT069_35835 [Planctomycetota bacterium]|nr:hypothetical protein [Planctomycetota bacterium]
MNSPPNSAPRLIRPAGRFVLLGAVVAFGLAVGFSHTGYESFQEFLGAATGGWLAPEPPPFASSSGQIQAEFWLAEVDRILTANPETAERLMGAAWALRKINLGRLSLRNPLRVLLGNDSETFRNACEKRSIELAIRATQLAPNDVQIWRNWAEFLLGPGLPDARGELDNVLLLLSEGAERDPDNALYDYTAALLMWENSSRTVTVVSPADVHEQIGLVAIEDDELFLRGNEAFERGLVKHQLAFSNTRGRDFHNLLRESSLPAGYQSERLAVFLLDNEIEFFLLFYSDMWRDCFLNERVLCGDEVGVMEEFRVRKCLADQVANGTGRCGTESTAWFCDLQAEVMLKLVNSPKSGWFAGEGFDPVQVTAIRHAASELNVTSLVLQAAFVDGLWFQWREPDHHAAVLLPLLTALLPIAWGLGRATRRYAQRHGSVVNWRIARPGRLAIAAAGGGAAVFLGILAIDVIHWNLPIRLFALTLLMWSPFVLLAALVALVLTRFQHRMRNSRVPSRLCFWGLLIWVLLGLFHFGPFASEAILNWCDPPGRTLPWGTCLVMGITFLGTYLVFRSLWGSRDRGTLSKTQLAIVASAFLIPTGILQWYAAGAAATRANDWLQRQPALDLQRFETIYWSDAVDQALEDIWVEVVLGCLISVLVAMTVCIHQEIRRTPGARLPRMVRLTLYPKSWLTHDELAARQMLNFYAAEALLFATLCAMGLLFVHGTVEVARRELFYRKVVAVPLHAAERYTAYRDRVAKIQADPVKMREIRQTARQAAGLPTE